MPPQRKIRKGEFICSCQAYTFPHRFGGGHCQGSFIVEQTWEANWGLGCCVNCNNLNTSDIPYCEVLAGQERIDQCPEWQDFVAYNEIKIRKI